MKKKISIFVAGTLLAAATSACSDDDNRITDTPTPRNFPKVLCGGQLGHLTRYLRRA